MSQELLVALNARWRDNGHPYAVGEGARWNLQCPACPGLDGGTDSLLVILGSALRHNQIHRTSASGGEIPDPSGTS